MPSSSVYRTGPDAYDLAKSKMASHTLYQSNLEFLIFFVTLPRGVLKIANLASINIKVTLQLSKTFSRAAKIPQSTFRPTPNFVVKQSNFTVG
jgi:hypothetical protein